MVAAFWDDSPEGTTKVDFWGESPEGTTEIDARELSIGFGGRSTDKRMAAVAMRDGGRERWKSGTRVTNPQPLQTKGRVCFTVL